MNPTNEQLKFINYKGSNSIILTATAGSGKTASTVARLNRMLKDGIDPKRMIFFSYTNDAVDELKTRIDSEDIKITTIHSFAMSMLTRMGMRVKIVGFYDFLNWYKETKKPSTRASKRDKDKFWETMEDFYENGGQISSQFAAYKLQKHEDIPVTMKPKYFDAYVQFMKSGNKVDFTDMLIIAEKLSRKNTWKAKFQDKYDYVFVDEYQDTSSIQMKILLRLKAKQYHLIGDPNQSLFGFTGANSKKIQELLVRNHKCEKMALSINFRSKQNIVENANKYTSLIAKSFDKGNGIIDQRIISNEEFFKFIQDDKPLAILCRTNNVIKHLEKEFLLSKLPFKYFNYITKSEIKKIKNGDYLHAGLQRRINSVVYKFGEVDDLVAFIESNEESKKLITSIHKSKGREYPRCIVINSFDPDTFDDYMTENDLIVDKERYTYEDDFGDIDEQNKNIHYVAVTRAEDELYFYFINEQKK